MERSYFDGGLAQLVAYKIAGTLITFLLLEFVCLGHSAWSIIGKQSTP